MKRKILRAAGFAGKYIWYGSIGTFLLAVVVYIAARMWLPIFIGGVSKTEAILSRLSGQIVRIEHIQPHWDGIFPGIEISGIEVFANDWEKPSVILDQVRVTMALLPLLRGELGIHRLVAVRPRLAVERLADGRYRITGFKTDRRQPASMGDAFVSWLFSQNEFSIEDGTLQWFDHSATDRQLFVLKQVNLSLSNSGRRHRLRFKADFPDKLCEQCALDLDIKGNPLVDDDWGGRINIEAIGLDISQLPAVMHSPVLKQLRGRFDLHLRTQWVQGSPRVAQGRLNASNINIPIPGVKDLVSINQVRGNIRWQGKKGAWRIDVSNAVLGLEGESWSAGFLRIDHNPEATHIRVQHIAVEQLVAFSKYVKLPARISQYIKSLQPSGDVNDLVVKLDRSPESTSRFHITAKLSRVAFNQFGRIPGVRGLSGYLVLSENTGAFRLNTKDAVLILPQVFREPLPARSLTGQVQWERKDDRWEIVGDDIRLTGDAVVRGNVLLRLPKNKTQSPYLKLRFDFSQVNGLQARKYYPINAISPGLLAWLDQAILAGQGVRGHVIFEGQTSKFPFYQGEGRFEVQALIRNAVLKYLEGWTPITGAEVKLMFRGPGMLITANSGWIDNLAVRNLVVRMRDLKDRFEPVHITGRLTGPAESTLAVLRTSPMAHRSKTWERFLAPGLEAMGPGSLSLELMIPPKAARETRISGEYRFLGSVVQVPIADFQFKNVRGSIRFTGAGFDKGSLQAMFLGEPVSIDLEGKAYGQLRQTVFKARGAVTANGLAGHFGEALGKFLTGKTQWEGELRLVEGMTQFKLRSDLGGLKTVLPAPYQELGSAQSRIILETEKSSKHRHRLRISLRDDINGKLDFRLLQNRWIFNGGHIGLGRSSSIRLPEHHGLHISLDTNHLNGDPWADLLVSSGTTPMPEFIQQLSANIDNLSVYGRHLGKVQFDLNREKSGWAGITAGDTAIGRIKLVQDRRDKRVELDLNRLRLPKKLPSTRKRTIDPRILPTLGIKAKKFITDSGDLGALDFWAAQTGIGWRIIKFNLERPEMRLISDGGWYQIAGRQSVEFDIQFDSTNMEQTLANMGVRDQIQGGKVKLKMDFRWRENPSRKGLANLSGALEISAKQGSLLNIKQGITRLAGAMNLTSLGRYMMLDFDPVVGEGFDFKNISGRIAIRNGNAYTDSFTINGLGADIVIYGRVGLVREDFNLVANVYPDLRGGITVASGWLWGPQTAALILAVQELFKDKIAKGTRITYTIKGSWKEPRIRKIAREPEEDTESDEQE